MGRIYLQINAQSFVYQFTIHTNVAPNALYQNCLNGSAPPNKIATRTVDIEYF